MMRRNSRDWDSAILSEERRGPEPTAMGRCYKVITVELSHQTDSAWAHRSPDPTAMTPGSSELVSPGRNLI